MAKRLKKRNRKGAKKQRNKPLRDGGDSNSAQNTFDEKDRRRAKQDASGIADSSGLLSQLGAGQLGRMPYFFFLVCLVAQLATILITWPTWQLRPVVDGTIPNLPWITDTPQFSTGILLVASLLLAAISPKKYGLLVHLVCLAVSISMDQFRCQPQILSIAFLMAACVWPQAKRLCLWYLVAMWTWAGIHKFLSPDWLGQVSCYLLSDFQTGLGKYGIPQLANPVWHYKKFAILVAATEVATGLLTWFRPKLAAAMCVALHLGILVFLLPMNWNQSVIPWNLATAIVGAWLLWTASGRSDLAAKDLEGENDKGKRTWLDSTLAWPTERWGRVVVLLFLVIPIGFYFGWVRHCFAHSLYSNNLPLGMITRIDETEFLESWEQLKFPFPNVQKAYRDYFRLTGKRNDKLHIRETKPWLPSHFYVHAGNRHFREVSQKTFLDPTSTAPLGMGIDDPRSVFQLFLKNAEMKKRHEDDMIYSIKFDSNTFHPGLLELLKGIPNLQQIELENCQVTDADLDRLPPSNRILGIGLNGTKVTEDGLKKLKQLENLSRVTFQGRVLGRESIFK